MPEITDHDRLTWLIREGAYSLVDSDSYHCCDSEKEKQEEARRRIDEMMERENQ